MSANEVVTTKKDELTNRLVKEQPHLGSILRELHPIAPDDLYLRIDERDGAARLATELPKQLKPADVALQYTGGQRTWELFGLFFMTSGRNHEAATLFYLLYDHLLNHQATA